MTALGVIAAALLVLLVLFIWCLARGASANTRWEEKHIKEIKAANRGTTRNLRP